MDLVVFEPNESDISGESQVFHSLCVSGVVSQVAFPEKPSRESGDVISDSRIPANSNPALGKLDIQPQSHYRLSRDPEILMICLVIASPRSRKIPRISPHAHPRIRGTNFSTQTIFLSLSCFPASMTRATTFS